MDHGIRKYLPKVRSHLLGLLNTPTDAPADEDVPTLYMLQAPSMDLKNGPFQPTYPARMLVTNGCIMDITPTRAYQLFTRIAKRNPFPDVAASTDHFTIEQRFHIWFYSDYIAQTRAYHEATESLQTLAEIALWDAGQDKYRDDETLDIVRAK